MLNFLYFYNIVSKHLEFSALVKILLVSEEGCKDFFWCKFLNFFGWSALTIWVRVYLKIIK